VVTEINFGFHVTLSILRPCNIHLSVALKEMITRNLAGGNWQLAHKAENLFCGKCESLDILQLYGPLWSVIMITLPPFYLYCTHYLYIYIYKYVCVFVKTGESFNIVMLQTLVWYKQIHKTCACVCVRACVCVGGGERWSERERRECYTVLDKAVTQVQVRYCHCHFLATLLTGLMTVSSVCVT
jgi:hypothetical protein